MSFTIPEEIEPIEIELPMGIDKWKQHGDKYGYTQYFKDELIKKIEIVRDSVRKQTGSFKYDDCYNDCIKLIQDIV